MSNAESDRPPAAEESPPSEEPHGAAPRRRALALPEGSLGIFLLLLFTALAGGLVATYWPLLFGGENVVSDERVTALETRVGQLATGHPNAAASGVFDDLRRNLTTLSDRLAADEARLTALEKTPASTPPAAPGEEAPAAGTPILRGTLDATAVAIAQLRERVGKLERSNANAEQISDLADKVVALRARVAALDADIARFSETQKGTMDAVNARLAKIEAALPPNLAQRLEDLAPKTDVATVGTRVARLESQNAGDVLHHAAAILALANLAGAAADGRPFTVELDALAAAEPGDGAVGALRPWAATGVPTVAMLRARFPAAARNALDVAHRAATAADYFSQMWSNIEGLVSVRRVGEVAGKDTDARLARAQVRVNAGDLAGAIAEAAAVRPPSAAPLAPWLRDARNRVALDRTLAQLNARVVRALAAAPNTAPATAPAPAQVPSSAP